MLLLSPSTDDVAFAAFAHAVAQELIHADNVTTFGSQPFDFISSNSWNAVRHSPASHIQRYKLYKQQHQVRFLYNFPFHSEAESHRPIGSHF
jgi:hypothetical protein